jgi:hypothetical protein
VYHTQTKKPASVVIGSSLLTENDTSKKAEGIIIGNIINLWNLFGRCKSVKI